MTGDRIRRLVPVAAAIGAPAERPPIRHRDRHAAITRCRHVAERRCGADLGQRIVNVIGVAESEAAQNDRVVREPLE